MYDLRNQALELMQTEEWRPVPDYPFEVSSHGRLRLLDSKMIIDPLKDGKGYLAFFLWRPPEYNSTKFSAHRLIASVFLGPCPPGKNVNHIDANPANNAVENLEYITQSENILHAVKMGRFPVGSRRWNSKLTEENVKEILSSPHDWKTVKSLAAKFGVTPPTIRKVINRENWKAIMNDAITTPLRCFDCGHEWTEPGEPVMAHCPECGSDDVLDPVTTDLEPDPDETEDA